MSRQSELAELSRIYDSSALSNRNLIINGGKTIDQRQSGSSVNLSATPAFVADRFGARLGTSSSSTGQQVADAPDGFYNSFKLTIGTGATAASNVGTNYYYTILEGLNTSHLNFGSSAAKTVTLSFYVKSSLTGTFGVTLGNYALNRSFPSSYTINSASTWERKTITITGDTSGTWLTTNSGSFYMLWDLGCGSDFKGTANTWAGSDYRGGATGTASICATSGATWQITGVQLEIGDSATPFEHRSYSDELLRCQRYFYALLRRDMNEDQQIGSYYSTTRAFINVPHKVTMRTAPTISVVGSVGADIYSAGAAISTTTLANSYPRFESTGLDFTPASSGTAGNAFHLDWTITASTSYIQANAEL